VCTRPLQAQTADNSRADYKRQFYVFVSGGVVSGVKLDLDPAIPVPSFNSWQIGGAAEWFQFKGLAIGGELAEAPRVTRAKPITYTYQTRSGAEATNTIAAGGVAFIGSFNVAYHFKGLPAGESFVPFATAGVSMIGREGYGLVEGTNYGGGISLWSSRRGVRLEYRKYVLAESPPGTRFRSLRVGLLLR
jgi:hypothetical protein